MGCGYSSTYTPPGGWSREEQARRDRECDHCMIAMLYATVIVCSLFGILYFTFIGEFHIALATLVFMCFLGKKMYQHNNTQQGQGKSPVNNKQE